MLNLNLKFDIYLYKTSKERALKLKFAREWSVDHPYSWRVDCGDVYENLRFSNFPFFLFTHFLSPVLIQSDS